MLIVTDNYEDIAFDYLLLIIFIIERTETMSPYGVTY